MKLRLQSLYKHCRRNFKWLSATVKHISTSSLIRQALKGLYNVVNLIFTNKRSLVYSSFNYCKLCQTKKDLLLFILCPLKVYCCSSCVLWKSIVVHLVSSESLLLFILCPLKVYCCSSCVLCKSTVVHLVSSESLLLFILCPLKVYCCSSCILWNSWLTNMF